MNIYGEEVDRLIPVVFLVIVGTVAVYGLTISPLERYLGQAQPIPQGVLLLAAWRMDGGAPSCRLPRTHRPGLWTAPLPQSLRRLHRAQTMIHSYFPGRA